MLYEVVTSKYGMKYLTTSEFASAIGVTSQTVRRWHSLDKLIPERVTSSGTRYYTQEQVRFYLHSQNLKRDYATTLGFCSLDNHSVDLDLQIKKVQTYLNMNARSTCLIVQDINTLPANAIETVLKNAQIQEIVICAKHETSCFNQLLLTLLKSNGVKIINVLNTI